MAEPVSYSVGDVVRFRKGEAFLGLPQDAKFRITDVVKGRADFTVEALLVGGHHPHQRYTLPCESIEDDPEIKAIQLMAPAPPMTDTSDPVNRPHHYARFEIEPVYFIMVNKLPFAIGNVIKYCCRWDAKDGIQDLKKARRYLDMEIKRLEGDKAFAE